MRYKLFGVQSVNHSFACPYLWKQEVAKHRTPNDAWMVYRNKVYDVSGWHEVRSSPLSYKPRRSKVHFTAVVSRVPIFTRSYHR